MSGTKFDQDKPAYHLIDARFDFDVLAAGMALDPSRSIDTGKRIRPEMLLISWAQWPIDNERSLIHAFWAVVSMYNTKAPVQVARLELARVLAFGAKKYAPNNWKGGFAWSRLWRAAYGHIEAHKRGDIYDPETGFLHLSHALCCLMFLIVHVRDGLGEDDREKIWPAVGDEGETTPEPKRVANAVHADGLRFDLEHRGTSTAAWRALASRAILLLSHNGCHRWDTHIDPSSRDERAVADAAFIEGLRELSWPTGS